MRIFFFSIIIFIVSCSPFKQTEPQLKEQDLSASCKGLIPLVKKNWKKHKELSHHQCNEAFLNLLQTAYLECIQTLTLKEVIQIFGEQPEEWGNSHVFYFLNEGCIGFPDNCELLLFAIHNGKVRSVYTQKQEDTVN